MTSEWTRRRKVKLTKQLMGDESGDYDREISSPAFPPSSITYMFARSPCHVSDKVYVAIDSGAGTNTLAMCSVIETSPKGHKSILGLECIINNTPQERKNYMVQHLEKIRDMVHKDVSIALLVENNLGMEAEYIAQHIHEAKIPNVHCINTSDTRKGVRITHPLNVGMRECLRSLLEMEMLDFHPGFFCFSLSHATVKMELERQMRDQRVVYLPNGETSTTLKSSPNELVSCLQLALYGKYLSERGDVQNEF